MMAASLPPLHVTPHLRANHLHSTASHLIPTSSAVTTSRWSEKVDTFAFGTVLLMLIAKRVLTEEDGLDVDFDFVYEWAENVYEQRKSSEEFTILHKSFQLEKGFSLSDGDRIERVATKCVHSSKTRISMKTALKDLVKLQAVKQILDDKELACLKWYLSITSCVA